MGEIVNHIMSEKESTEIALIVSRQFRLECIRYTILKGFIRSKCQMSVLQAVQWEKLLITLCQKNPLSSLSYVKAIQIRMHKVYHS